MGYTIDIDTGGTFTDGFFVGDSIVKTVKVPTTPHDLTVCLLGCIEAGAKLFKVTVEDMLMDTEVIRFSTTIGTNTLIERNGTRIGLLVTKGEEKGLEVVGEDDEEAPLVYPEMVRTLAGAVNERGEITEALNREEVLSSAQELLDLGARCLVVSLKNSALNASLEQEARNLIKAEYPRDYLGSVPVFLSSDITNLLGDRQRTNAAVVNAYIHARLVRFLYKSAEDLRNRFYSRPLLIVHATGGVTRVANTRAINTYNSGPAAGLMGVAALSRQYKTKEMVSGDMGGTSFDIGIVKNGYPNFTLKPTVEGIELATPMVSIKAIGAGGGSIAVFRGGGLSVGPQSAGALPGPACFALGGANATVTDADVALGYIDPDYYMGGKMRLDKEKALEAIKTKIASPMQTDLVQAALAIRDKVDQNMGLELKAVVESMRSDTTPTFVVYGGAGSAHCCGIAFYAGIKKIVAPRFASVFSASSLSGMDVWHIYSRRLGVLIKENAGMLSASKTIDAAVRDMYAEARRDMRGEGFEEKQVKYLLEFILSCDGETPAGRITIKGANWSENLADALRTQAPKLSEQQQLFSPLILLHATAPIPHFKEKEYKLGPSDPSAAIVRTRLMCWNEEKRSVETPVYDRMKLKPGNIVLGPAVVEAPDTTYVVRGHWSYTVDKFYNGIFEEVTT